MARTKLQDSRIQGFTAWSETYHVRLSLAMVLSTKGLALGGPKVSRKSLGAHYEL